MRAAAAVLALVLGACTPSAPPKPAAASAPASAEDRLIAANVRLPGDDALMAQYRDINEGHFGGRLPAIPVRWEPGLEGVVIAAAPSLKLEGLWGRDARGEAAILLNAKLKGDAGKVTSTLCHEMIHEYLDTIGRGSARHGPEFQAQLKRLLAEGAFQGEAPSEGEKQGLRDWLAKQRGEIDEQARLLKEKRAALGPRPSHEAVDDYNALVQRQTLMVGDYNREVERYNALNAYPDGLDEENAVAAR